VHIASVSPRLRWKLLIGLLAVLGGMYAIGWFAPAIGLAYRDGAVLVTARTLATGQGYAIGSLPAPVGETSIPPLFSAVLALFSAISQQARWLKVVPLSCALGWLALTRRLLIKMGASRECALLLVVMTAASPTVLYLSTGLFPEPLTGLLLTASLLALLHEKPLLAGVLAGLATITELTAATLILASMLTLAATGRFRSAIRFTAGAIMFVAPWFGWALARGGSPITHLHMSEEMMVLGNNSMLLAASPFTLLTGYTNLYPGLLTAVVVLIVLIRRRYFVPDLFLGFYFVALIFRASPPLDSFVPILPLFLWMLWRAARGSRFASLTTIAAVLVILPGIWFSGQRVRTAITRGSVASGASEPSDWRQMENLFAFIRGNTSPGDVLLANLDPMFYLNTGRKTVRGFAADDYRSYYAPPRPLVTPDQLGTAVLREHVRYVALTPDADRPESVSFHRSVEALERGGVLEPVSVPNASAGYRLLRVH
jgi:hypothetical protein